MRFTAFVACLLAALDCAQTAVGNKPQSVFTPDHVAMWWLFTVAWGAAGFRILLEGTQ